MLLCFHLFSCWPFGKAFETMSTVCSCKPVNMSIHAYSHLWYTEAYMHTLFLHFFYCILHLHMVKRHTSLGTGLPKWQKQYFWVQRCKIQVALALIIQSKCTLIFQISHSFARSSIRFSKVWIRALSTICKLQLSQRFGLFTNCNIEVRIAIIMTFFKQCWGERFFYSFNWITTFKLCLTYEKQSLFSLYVTRKRKIISFMVKSSLFLDCEDNWLCILTISALNWPHL